MSKVGMIKATEFFDGVPKGTVGHVSDNSIMFEKCSYGHLPLYSWGEEYCVNWWDKAIPIDGPLVELASEVLREGDDG